MKPVKTRRADAPALEWICDISGKAARITSIGSRSLLVENHCGICEFTQERIVIATRCGPLEILGSGLSLRQVRRCALIVCGSIQDVKLPCSEANGHEP